MLPAARRVQQQATYNSSAGTKYSADKQLSQQIIAGPGWGGARARGVQGAHLCSLDGKRGQQSQEGGLPPAVCARLQDTRNHRVANSRLLTQGPVSSCHPKTWKKLSIRSPSLEKDSN